jgi:hypothetical protein
MTAAFTGDTSLVFFKLILELRNRVYDIHGQSNNIIAVTQYVSKIDIRAYFDDIDVSGRNKRFGRYRFYQQAQHSRHEALQPATPLPRYYPTIPPFVKP